MITTFLLAFTLTATKVDVRPNVVVTNQSTRSFVIPAAGSVAGGGGTLFFRSDVTLVNNDDEAQEISVIWIPIGGEAQTFRLSPALPANTPPVTIVDFVGTVLRVNGLGSLVFVPVDANGNVDPVASLNGFSRIWTRQPGSSGTVSQPFAAVDPNHLRDHRDGFMLGLRQDAGFRTNYGIVNLDEEPHTFLVTIFPERNGGHNGYLQFDVRLGAMAMTQAAIPGGDLGALTIIVSTDTEQSIPWTAYASSTDNTTGDGWVSMATAFLLPEQVPSRSSGRRGSTASDR